MATFCKVALDKSKFGRVEEGTVVFDFFMVGKNGDEEFITRRKCAGDVLVAVTQEQFTHWKNQKIVSKMVETKM